MTFKTFFYQRGAVGRCWAELCLCSLSCFWVYVIIQIWKKKKNMLRFEQGPRLQDATYSVH